jgi:tRNA(Arg) A34 adenosine deaminase TadA
LLNQKEQLALKVPQFPFGAIIVKRDTGEIIAERFNQSTINPTFHGEMEVLDHCAQLQQHRDWNEFELYTTGEPFQCQSPIKWAGIARVCFGTSIPYLNTHNWQQINIRASEVIAQTAFLKTPNVGGILEAIGRTLDFGEVSFTTTL